MNPFESEHTTRPKNKPSLMPYLMYGAGSLATGLTYSLNAFLLLEYSVSVQRITLKSYVWIFFAAQIMSAIFNPIIGICSDRVKSTRWRHRVFILVSAVTMPLFFFLMFLGALIPVENGRIAYAFVMLVLFYFAEALFTVPYKALVMELHGNGLVRSYYVLSSAIFFCLGFILGPMVIVSIKDYALPSYSEKLFYILFSLLVSAIAFIAILLVFFSTRKQEEKEIETEMETEMETGLETGLETGIETGTKTGIVTETLCTQLFECINSFRNNVYLNFTVVYASSQVAVDFLLLYMLLYLRHATDLPDILFIGVVSVSSIPGIIIVHFLIKRYGHKKAYLLPMFLLIASAITNLATPKNEAEAVVLIIFPALLGGLGIGACFYMSSLMLLDVMTNDFLLERKHREGFLSSFYVFFQKLLFGIINLSIAYLLEHSDSWAFDNGKFARTQPDSIVNVLQISASLIPLVFAFVSFSFRWISPLSDSEIEKNREDYDLLVNKSDGTPLLPKETARLLYNIRPNNFFPYYQIHNDHHSWKLSDIKTY